MSIVKKSFGMTKDGEKATLYVIINKKGMEVSFTDYGANIVNILVPDKNGVKKDVVLGYDSVTGYEDNAPGYGSFIGRNANRIANAEVTINGTVYQLEKNDGINNLHSGNKSYNKYMYETEIFEEEDVTCIEFSRFSPHMEQGFPGNLDITVTYTLTEDNELVIEYFAVSDAETIVNFTNHSYFNLAGHNSGSVLEQKVRIFSDQFSNTDSLLIPDGKLIDVTGTPFDFREMKAIGKDIACDYEPLKLGGGYDHNYILNTSREEAGKVAELYDEKSGRFMEVFTDLPGIQLYSANFIAGNEAGKEGYIYQKRDGICFESQFYPNSCNMENVPNGRIRAGEEFESVTIYKFSVK